ncbi:MAG TPA: aminotransferase class I/II-fold pyridoxal phosphate-dependent enzyme [Desulfobacteraceae bacterium]|nr:aminotransferase class I/II-fold pyridoxal phosphate-dependent enzyme [Desulfobacteraceae bacterium]
MNPIAQSLNTAIRTANEHIYEMLSKNGKELFFPKGILTQGAEARERAHKFNATVGMATEKGHIMNLPTIMEMLPSFTAEQALTYAPSFGIMPLRQAWREAEYRKNPSLEGKEISLPIVTNALTHGLSVTARMWVNPGDVVLLPDKIWGNYNLIFQVLEGARIEQFPFFNQRMGFNIEAFDTAVRTHGKNNGKIIVILNIPNNPIGYTVTPAEADEIAASLEAAAADGINVIAVADDAYFGLVYEEGVLEESIFARIQGRHPRLLAVKVDGATKEDLVWGLRVGFVTYGAVFEGDSRAAYEALEKKTAGAVRGSISNASHLGQEIMLRALENPRFAAEKREKFNLMKERAIEVKRVLSNPAYSDAWDVYPFNSGYFMCLRIKGVDAEALRLHLLETYGVGVISIDETDVRIAFSCIDKENIQEIFDTIHRAVKDLQR